MKIQTRPLLRRIIEIHNKIQRNEFPTTKSLAKDLEAGTATISRTLETMKDELGAPIEYDYKKRGLYYSQNYELPFVKLTGDYAESLECAKTLLMCHKKSPLYKSLETTLDNIISPSIKNDTSSLFNRIEVISRAEYPSIPQKNWKIIVQAVCENKVLTFSYKSKRQNENEDDLNRTIHPYEIVLDGNNAYIFALDKKDNRTKLFTISKINNPKITDRDFKLPEDFKFKKANGNGRFGAYISPKGMISFKIKFKRMALKEIANKTFFDDQEITKCEDESIVMSFSSVQYELILEWIMSFAENAIPIEPEELVNDWKDKWNWTIDSMRELLK